MKNIIISITAAMMAFGAVVYAKNTQEKTNANNCCAPSSECCYDGSPCCSVNK